jgi:wee1-like protein kinase
MHGKGIAHLDVKPDNIYVKNGVYKLGDFGCATLIDSSLPIEEGDARYMPQEILNENFDHLDKVDIFSLGVSIYELVRKSPLPESGGHCLNLKEGKLPLLPGHSLQFQNLLKVLSNSFLNTVILSSLCFLIFTLSLNLLACLANVMLQFSQLRNPMCGL